VTVNDTKEHHMRNNPNDRPIIDVRRLGKTYPGKVEAVKEVDFQVASGEVFGLLGPSGSRKPSGIEAATTLCCAATGTARRSV